MCIRDRDDVPLMRVRGQGEVFFAASGGYVYLIDLGGDGISINGRNLLAFDAALNWDCLLYTSRCV